MAAFGNVYKITPEIFSTWMTLLKEIPNAILWVIDDNPATTANLKAHAAAENIDLKQIQFTARTTHIEYRAKLKLADVFLDTFPYNCGSTSIDVINACVPLITISGKTLVSRMGGSILNKVGLDTYICKNYNEYIKKIISLSKTGRRSHSIKIKKTGPTSNSLTKELGLIISNST
jgi:predicted O-linked N-acetylglucosamine transferase (SPINDLY family)